jgi:release factor glutamine methyltransferase
MRFGQEIQTLSRNARLNMTQTLQAGVTRGEALAALRALFVDSGIDDGAVDARVLLCAADDIKSADLIRAPKRTLSDIAIVRLAPMAGRRAAGEPVSRILSQREFWGLPLAISPDVLDPRADTETLVEAVVKELAHKRNARLRILDLGAGSGAILCALLREFGAAVGMAADLSAAAAALARANLATCGFAGRSSVMVGSWGRAVSGTFDVVVSNPPYIPSHQIGALQREVRDHDPHLALDGGLDGLDAYRALAPQLARLLVKDGRFFLEFGASQADSVTAILAGHGLTKLTIYPDLAGLNRVVSGGVGADRFGSMDKAGPPR